MPQRAVPGLEPHASRRWAAVAFVALAAACTAADDTPPDSGTPDAGPVDAGPGDPNVTVGRFAIRHVAPSSDATAGSEGYTSLVGKVFDGPTPSAIVWEEVRAEGDCRLLAPRVPFCASPCGGSAVCVEDDTCRAYPKAFAVGDVAVTGLRTTTGATTFTLKPIANTYQPGADVTLPFDALAAGETVKLEAAGSPFAAAFALEARGVGPLVLSDTTLTLDGSPLALAWTPPADPALARITVKLDVSHHGGSKGMITCDTADDGALTLSGALVTALTDLGVAGFPTIILTRSAGGSAVIHAGRVELSVSAVVERPVDVPGLASCTADAQCPANQRCRSDLTCG